MPTLTLDHLTEQLELADEMRIGRDQTRYVSQFDVLSAKAAEQTDD